MKNPYVLLFRQSHHIIGALLSPECFEGIRGAFYNTVSSNIYSLQCWAIIKILAGARNYFLVIFLLL